MKKKVVIPLVSIGSSQAGRLLSRITAARTARNHEVERAVEKILRDIETGGDSALIRYTEKFDKKKLTVKTLRLDPLIIASQAKKAPALLKKTIREAAARIRAFHSQQRGRSFSITTAEGTLSQIVRPLHRVGVYIPGGYTMYPSSVLMNVIPAQIAGVEQIVAVTPPREPLDPAIAYVLHWLKVAEVYQVGGSQAIGALAYGTKSIKPVDKIVGPGNSYVAMAKKMVYGAVDIDSVAGPSEVVVLADSSVDPSWVALDLLSQAEHGSGDETAVCVTEDMRYAQRIQKALIREIEGSAVREVFSRLSSHAISLFVTASRDESIEFINSLAPEHLQIMTGSFRSDVKRIRNAAAVFCGPYTPVALGDYFIGTNHVLPTGSAARYASPLGVESFLKRCSVAEVSRKGLAGAAPHVSRFARAEHFLHHALSVERRIKGFKGDQ